MCATPITWFHTPCAHLAWFRPSYSPPWFRSAFLFAQSCFSLKLRSPLCVFPAWVCFALSLLMALVLFALFLLVRRGRNERSEQTRIETYPSLEFWGCAPRRIRRGFCVLVSALVLAPPSPHQIVRQRVLFWGRFFSFLGASLVHQEPNFYGGSTYPVYASLCKNS